MVAEVASSRNDASNYVILLSYRSADVASSDPASSNYISKRGVSSEVARRLVTT
jgi:hypothetical protein